MVENSRLELVNYHRISINPISFLSHSKRFLVTLLRPTYHDLELFMIHRYITFNCNLLLYSYDTRQSIQ